MSFNPERINIKDLTIEEPEPKKEELGRDPEVFLRGIFNKHMKEDRLFHPQDVSWYLSDDGRFINMNYGPNRSFEVPIDKVSKDKFPVWGKVNYGVNKLISELKGKEIISIDMNGFWVLEIVESNQGESSEPETSHLPEVRSF